MQAKNWIYSNETGYAVPKCPLQGDTEKAVRGFIVTATKLPGGAISMVDERSEEMFSKDLLSKQKCFDT